MNDQPKTAAQKILLSQPMVLLRVEQLFYKHVRPEVEDEFLLISEYFNLLVATIDVDSLQLTVNSELLTNFHALVLLLRDRLTLCPEVYQAQMIDLLTKSDLERVIDIISVSSPDEFSRMLYPRRSISGMLAEWAFGSKNRKQESEAKTVTHTNLLDAKITLHKLAQLAKYLATIEFRNYEPDWQTLSDHFNPDLLNKQRILALVDLLKSDLLSLEDSHIRARLVGYVEKLETELRAKRPRWRKIIHGFVVVLSFLADLKAVTPGVYDSVYNDVAQIVAVIVQDCGVERHRQTPSLPQDNRHSPPALLPEPPKVKRDD